MKRAATGENSGAMLNSADLKAPNVASVLARRRFADGEFALHEPPTQPIGHAGDVVFTECANQIGKCSVQRRIGHEFRRDI